MKQFLPTAPQISQEALKLIAGALLAALIVGQLPGVKAWVKKQWQADPRLP